MALLAPLGRKTAAVPEVAGLAVEGQELETDGRVDLGTAVSAGSPESSAVEGGRAANLRPGRPTDLAERGPLSGSVDLDAAVAIAAAGRVRRQELAQVGVARRAAVARLAALVPRVVPAAALLAASGPAALPGSLATAAGLEVRPVVASTAGVLVDEAFVAALPALGADKVSANTATALAALGEAEVGVQAASLKPVRAATRPAVDAARHAVLAGRPALLNLPFGAAEAIRLVGPRRKPTVVVAAAVAKRIEAAREVGSSVARSVVALALTDGGPVPLARGALLSSPSAASVVAPAGPADVLVVALPTKGRFLAVHFN